jgi:hypothetical protein
MFKYLSARHLPYLPTQTRITKPLWIWLALGALMITLVKPTPAAVLDISPDTPQTYYSWTGSNFTSVPGAIYLGTYRLTTTSVTDWRYVPWETIHTNNPASASLPTFYKGLSAMIAEGKVSGGVRWPTIQTDSLAACSAYVRYLWGAYNNPSPHNSAATFIIRPDNGGCGYGTPSPGYSDFGPPLVATTCTTKPTYYPAIPYGYNKVTNRCERMIPAPVCPTGQKPHPITGCMLDCPVGSFPNLNDTACVLDSAPSCDIKPMLPLPIESTDQCTAALENPSYTQAQRDAVCGTLTPAMQTEVACFTEKLAQKGITIKINNKVRSTAYQAHFRDVWDKMEKVTASKIQRDLIMQAACAPRRAELAAEKGCNLSGNCTRVNPVSNKTESYCPLGGHCLVAKPAPANGSPQHAFGKAIDIRAANVNALISALSNPPPPKTIQQFLMEPATPPAPAQSCSAPKLQWGGAWGDNVHFYLP